MLVFDHVFAWALIQKAAIPLVIRLDAELESGLRALRAEQNMPQAEVVRSLIRERLAQRRGGKSAYEIARAMALLASTAIRGATSPDSIDPRPRRSEKSCCGWMFGARPRLHHG